MFKNFDTSLVLPLLGVAIGWILSEAGFLLRERRDRKKVVGQIILRLLHLRQMMDDELQRIAVAQELLKSGLFSMDARKRIAGMKDDRIDDCLTGSNALMDEIAGVDPFLAFELEEKLRPAVTLIREAGGYLLEWEGLLPEVQDLWKKSFLFTERIAFQGLADALEKSIRKLAWRKGVPSAIRCWLHFRNETKLRKQHPHEEYGQIMADMDAMNEKLNRYSERKKAKDTLA
jgi:hypothetical protein